ncbi:MAG TPA: hypothetical protein G4N94_13465 [Caldilineae bacterium]|nr:hypothetical protein [Caldilineae bacterium]
MSQHPPSPRITGRAWGRIDVEGYDSFKDVKLYPGGARAWRWEETGTSHAPGVQFVDVEELLAHGATVVVLTTGVLGRLKVQPETLQALAEQGITVFVKRTPKAVQLYNELRETAAVGALIHSTC